MGNRGRAKQEHGPPAGIRGYLGAHFSFVVAERRRLPDLEIEEKHLSDRVLARSISLTHHRMRSADWPPALSKPRPSSVLAKSNVARRLPAASSPNSDRP